MSPNGYTPYAQRRRDAVSFIDWYITEHGYPPSVRDLAAAIGVGSSRAFDILERMEQDGLITRPRHDRQQRVGRAMRLTDAAMILLREEI